jgi:hypothetical protein
MLRLILIGPGHARAMHRLGAARNFAALFGATFRASRAARA